MPHSPPAATNIDELPATPVATPGVARSEDRPVSVVVPLFNERECVESLTASLAAGRAANSATATTSSSCSSTTAAADGTPALLKAAVGEDRRYRVIEHGRNRGIAAAIGTGIAAASHEVVVSLDCDGSLRPAAHGRTDSPRSRPTSIWSPPRPTTPPAASTTSPLAAAPFAARLAALRPRLPPQARRATPAASASTAARPSSMCNLRTNASSASPNCSARCCSKAAASSNTSRSPPLSRRRPLEDARRSRASLGHLQLISKSSPTASALRSECAHRRQLAANETCESVSESACRPHNSYSFSAHCYFTLDQASLDIQGTDICGYRPESSSRKDPTPLRSRRNRSRARRRRNGARWPRRLKAARSPAPKESSSSGSRKSSPPTPGVASAYACSHGTAALHTALAAIDPEPGDEVITTAITDMGSHADHLPVGHPRLRRRRSAHLQPHRRDDRKGDQPEDQGDHGHPPLRQSGADGRDHGARPQPQHPGDRRLRAGLGRRDRRREGRRLGRHRLLQPAAGEAHHHRRRGDRYLERS